MAYSTKDDLLIGNIPLPGYIDSEKVVEDAADEIDSAIGFVYKTPIEWAVEPPTTVALQRPSRLLLKRINNYLATGRLILETAAAAEHSETHAYANRLLREANASLNAIARGEIVLEGAERIDQDQQVTTVMIHNVDPESNVEAFYDRIAKPRTGFGFSEVERGFVR